jgi:hypothetical protein
MTNISMLMNCSDAFERWARHLMRIVNPTALGKVEDLAERRRA